MVCNASFDSGDETKPTGTPITSAGLANLSLIMDMTSKSAVGALPTTTTEPFISFAAIRIATCDLVLFCFLASSKRS